MKARVATVVATGFSLLEAPRWGNNELIVSDFFTNSVIKFPSPVGGNQSTICLVPGQPSGLALADDGSIFIVSMLEHKLLSWKNSSLQVVADLSGYFNSPANDMAMDSAGRCYVGSFGLENPGSTKLVPTHIVRVDPDGSIKSVADDLIFPNGIVFSADERTLFVAETYLGRVTAFDVLPNGDLGSRRVWASFGEPPVELEIRSATEHLRVLPDGLTLDTEGALWVADAKGQGIARVAEGGEYLDYVSTGDLSVYAAALGGPELKTLFLCCSPPVETFDPLTSFQSVLMTCEVPVAGVPRR